MESEYSAEGAAGAVSAATHAGGAAAVASARTGAAARGRLQAMTHDSVKTVIAASMVGTAIEFYDFYAYGTASANYFPKLFFSDTTNPTVALLVSLLTFAVAFVARPFGSLIFGHFGDKMGRKTTLVVSLLTMGVSTFLIGCLPTYSTWGLAAVFVLCLCRFVQGIGLGGEWSGAALVATENAPESKRALYGSFPELGAPIGFFLCNGLFCVLEGVLSPEQMLNWGWRVPFLLSSVLVIVGLLVRMRMEETPVFRLAQQQKRVVKSPLKEVFRTSWRQILQSTFIVGVTYTLFYTLTTWSLAWGTKDRAHGGGGLGFSNREYMFMQLASIVFFAVFIVLSCVYADRIGRRRTLIFSAVGIVVFSFIFPYLMMGNRNVLGTMVFLVVGFALMGIAFGPLGAALPELFPANVRYSGSGLGYNFAAIVGAAFAPTFATWLAQNWGVKSVGLYMAVMGVCSLVALLTSKETKDTDFTK